MTLERTYNALTVTGTIKRTGNENYQELLDALKDTKTMIIIDSFCITSDVTILLKKYNIQVETCNNDLDDLLRSLDIKVRKYSSRLSSSYL